MSSRDSSYDLPPTSLAKALPTKVFANSKPTSLSQLASKRPKKRSRQNDDTPRAFTRMLALRDGKKLPSGLDDGYSRKKTKPSTSNLSNEPKQAISSSNPALQRLPHESMSAFSQRVNAALPLSGLSKSRPDRGELPSIKGLRSDGTKRTRMEKKMQKMQQEWREAKKRRDEAMVDSEEEEDDDEAMGNAGAHETLKAGATQGKRGKSSKKRRRGAEESDDEDPWAGLNARKRAAVQTASADTDRGLVGLHDVVVAPPKLSAPRAVFGDMAKDIPKGAGSLRRREELSKARAAVLNAIRSKAGRSEPGVETRNGKRNKAWN